MQASNVMDHDVYMRMHTTDAICSIERIISEDSFVSFEAGNISPAVSDLQNAEDPKVFVEFGIDLSKHSDCVKLMNSIHTYGY